MSASPAEPAVSAPSLVEAAPVAPAAPPPRSRRTTILAGAALLALAIGGYRLATTWGRVSTDNAAVEGHVVVASARVGGVVKEVRVVEGQPVHQGEVVVVLDPADYDVRLAAAEADLQAAVAAAEAARAQLDTLTGTTKATLSGANAGVDGARAGVAASQSAVPQAEAAYAAAVARADQAAADFARAKELFASGGLTRAALDAAETGSTAAAAARAQAEAALTSARQNVEMARGRLDEAVSRFAAANTGDYQVAAAAAQLKAAEARVAQSTANRDTARLQRTYTEVTAPFDAVVAKVNAEVGQSVGPGVGLVGLTGSGEVWVVANLKETQLDGVDVGDVAHVTVDALPGRTFDGTVSGISAATGARFSLLPPDNASGNFTKVVQRVPVRIALPAEAVGLARPGMSALVTIDLGGS